MIPSVIHQLVTYLENHQADLSTLVVVGSGAAYLPPQLADKLTSLVPKTTVFFVGATWFRFSSSRLIPFA